MRLYKVTITKYEWEYDESHETQEEKYFLLKDNAKRAFEVFKEAIRNEYDGANVTDNEKFFNMEFGGSYGYTNGASVTLVEIETED